MGDSYLFAVAGASVSQNVFLRTISRVPSDVCDVEKIILYYIWIIIYIKNIILYYLKKVHLKSK